MHSNLLQKPDRYTAKVGHEGMVSMKSATAPLDTAMSGKTSMEALLQELRPLREVSARQIAPEVLLAQALTPEQERVLYFPVERYRLLGTRVLQVAQNQKSKMMLVTSAIAEEGKTLTAVNLAFALASAVSNRILLIEMDLRRPSLSRLLGLQADPSEPSFLEADDWRDCLWGLRPNLHALVLSSPLDRPDVLLNSESTRDLLAEARAEYDIVVIDSAPLLLTVDTHVLLPLVDHAMLVVRADHTPIACSQDALGMLGEKALGCILNDTKRMKYEEYYRAYYR